MKKIKIDPKEKIKKTDLVVVFLDCPYLTLETLFESFDGAFDEATSCMEEALAGSKASPVRVKKATEAWTKYLTDLRGAGLYYLRDRKYPELSDFVWAIDADGKLLNMARAPNGDFVDKNVDNDSAYYSISIGTRILYK